MLQEAWNWATARSIIEAFSFVHPRLQILFLVWYNHQWHSFDNHDVQHNPSAPWEFQVIIFLSSPPVRATCLEVPCSWRLCKTRVNSWCKAEPVDLSGIKPSWILLETKSVPEIGSVGLQCHKYYRIFALDPNVIMSDTGIQTVVIHWYQPYLTFNCTNRSPSDWEDTLLAPDSNSTGLVAPYIGPSLHPTRITAMFFSFSKTW